VGAGGDAGGGGAAGWDARASPRRPPPSIQAVKISDNVATSEPDEGAIVLIATLGSTAGGVLRLVMGDGARLGVVGLGLGLAGALASRARWGGCCTGCLPVIPSPSWSCH
jgi:hypothetical protein